MYKVNWKFWWFFNILYWRRKQSDMLPIWVSYERKKNLVSRDHGLDSRVGTFFLLPLLFTTVNQLKSYWFLIYLFILYWFGSKVGKNNKINSEQTKFNKVEFAKALFEIFLNFFGKIEILNWKISQRF